MNYEKLINEFETPFYAFDTDILQERIAYIKSSLPSDIALCYAVKANTFIVKQAEPLVSRLEVCSPGEFEICENANIPMEKIVLSGVYKEAKFIERVMTQYDIGIYTVESLSQYELLKSLCQKSRKTIDVLVRITSKNQFGISEQDFETILKDGFDKINIIGIQFFASTQKSLKKLKRELEYLSSLITKFKDEYGFSVRELEYGTGSPIAYFDGEEFDEKEYFLALSSLLEGFAPKVKITIEIGRSIAACCGAYFSSVVDIKSNKAGKFAIIDGGMNHLVYYGQSMAMKHPHVDIYPKRKEENAEEWNICGSLCTVNDIVVKALPVTNLSIGDTLIFKNTGAYCMCEGISLFLSRELPAIVITNEKNTALARNHFKTSALNKGV